jgi:hypothetical protein
MTWRTREVKVRERKIYMRQTTCRLTKVSRGSVMVIVAVHQINLKVNVRHREASVCCFRFRFLSWLNQSKHDGDSSGTPNQLKDIILPDDSASADQIACLAKRYMMVEGVLMWCITQE